MRLVTFVKRAVLAIALIAILLLAGIALYPCGVLTFNDANLAMVRNTAAKGAD